MHPDNYSEQFKAKPVGYRTEHDRWWSVQGHADAEAELGNDFPDVSHLGDHEGIWVTHTKKDATQYGPRSSVVDVNLEGARPIHTDQDGGYFYVRQKIKGAV